MNEYCESLASVSNAAATQCTAPVASKVCEIFLGYETKASVKTKEPMPKNAKTLMYRGEHDKKLHVKIADKDGNVDRDRVVMPDIEDVEVIKREYKSRVIVTFSDGAKEVATLNYGDNFNLEQGITVCIIKKLLSDEVGKGLGGSTYNKIIDHAIRIHGKSAMAKLKKEADEAAKKRKHEKMIAKKEAKRERRQAEERENQIEIQKEAYLRAMHEFHTRSAD